MTVRIFQGSDFRPDPLPADLTDAEIAAGVAAICSGDFAYDFARGIIPIVHARKVEAATPVTSRALDGPLNHERWPRSKKRRERLACLCAAIRVGYPVLRTDLLPGQWAHANGKVEEFRAEKRKFGIGA